MKSTGRTMATLATVGAALALLLLVPGMAAPASASPVPAAGSNTQQWAYGAQKWVNVTENFSNATYDAKAFFGWQVVITATNTSSTTVALEAQRTVIGSYFAELCAPNCASPTLGHGNLSVVAWEKETGFANVTSAATVYENGSAVPALGLINASAQASGNISEQLAIVLTTPGFTGSTAASLFVSGSAHSTLSFSPSLGLVPLNASPGQTWNSSAPFAAAGAWSLSASWSHTPFVGGTHSGTYSPSGSVQGNGTLELTGADLGTVTLHNGATVPVIALVWNGPFDDLDGVILVPHDFDLFGDAPHEYAGASVTTQTAATSNVDLAMDAGHRLHVVAAATSFAEADTSLAPAAAAPVRGPSPAGTSSSATVLQAQPESVGQAQSASGCYVGACPGAASSGAGGLLGLALVVGLVIAVVVGSVSVIEYRIWARRRADGGLSGSPSPIRQAMPPPGAFGGPAVPPASPPGSGPRDPPRIG